MAYTNGRTHMTRKKYPVKKAGVRKYAKKTATRKKK